jgi:STE24 endopeptidase
MTPILRVIGLFVNAISRSFERRADSFAVKKGYGEAMISALKKLSKDNLSDLNPHPFIVTTEYSHPTLSQRIDLVEKKIADNK